MRFIFSSFISIFPFVLMLASCGETDIAAKQTARPTTVDQAQATTPLSKADWHKIEISWVGEALASNCARGEISLSSSGMIESNACGQIRSIDISGEDIAAVNALMPEVSIESQQPMKCFEQEGDDSVIEMKIVNNAGNARLVYQLDVSDTCYRGESEDRVVTLFDKIEQLRAKYLEFQE